MPIDPNTGMYVNPIGGISPGGNASAALGILSDMLASQNAGMVRQAKEIELAKKQHDFQSDLDYEDAIRNAQTDEERTTAAMPYAKPDTLVRLQELKAQREATAAQRQAANAVRDKEAETRWSKVASDAGLTYAQWAEGAYRGGWIPQDVKDLYTTGPKASERYSPMADAKLGSLNAGTELKGALTGKAEAQTEDIEATRKSRIALIDSRTGLNNEKVRASRLKNTVDAIRDAQRNGAGKMDPKRFDQLRREKSSLLVRVENIKRSIRGLNKVGMSEEEKQDAEASINELQSQIKEVESLMAGIQVSGQDFSDVQSGTSSGSMLPPRAANADTPPGFRPGDKVTFLTNEDLK